MEGLMTAAFAKAGYRPPEAPEAKLCRLMARAIKRGASPLPEPAIERFKQALRDDGDVDLVLLLCAERAAPAAMLRLYHEVIDAIRKGQDKAARRYMSKCFLADLWQAWRRNAPVEVETGPRAYLGGFSEAAE